MVNPNTGRSVSPEIMASDRAKAEVDGEAELRRWATQHLNVEIGVALQSDRWEGADYWAGAADPTLTSLDELLARSEVATVGIDGGGLDDLLGLCVIGRCRTTRDYLVWCRAWAHARVLDRRKEIAPRLLDFARAGEMAIGDDLEAHPRELAAIVAGVHGSGLLPKQNAIGVDVAAVSDIVDALAEAQVPTDLIVGVPQGWRMAGNIKGAGRRLAAGTLWHADQALMAWCVGNAKTEPRGNAVLITKQANGTAKIDPLLAFLNAFDLMSRNPEAAPRVEAEVVFL
jgi:phage terminase large subunit-like protein